MPAPSDPRFVDEGEEDHEALDGSRAASSRHRWVCQDRKECILGGWIRKECPSGLVRSRARRPAGIWSAALAPLSRGPSQKLPIMGKPSSTSHSASHMSQETDLHTWKPWDSDGTLGSLQLGEILNCIPAELEFQTIHGQKLRQWFCRNE